MSKRDNVAPFERHQARKWTRVSDYLPGAEAQVLLPPPAKRREPARPAEKRVSRRGLWLPIYLLALAAAALWLSGALDRAGTGSAPQDEQAAPGATRVEGVVFGLCDQGGGLNCVVGGDSFFLAGKSVRIAGLKAPNQHAPACGAEAVLGQAATGRLHALLNSGAVTMVPAAADRDSNGRLLRQVRVDGKDVAATLITEGLARPEGDARGWC